MKPGAEEPLNRRERQGGAIKGPSRKSRHVIRRTWECPVCHRREWTGGDVVTRRCRCAPGDDPAAQPWMHLVDEPTPRRQKSRPAEAATAETNPPASPPGDEAASHEPT